MKSFAVTLLAAVGLAYAGVFFEIWNLSVFGEDPVTFKDVGRKLGHYFDYTDDFREIREEELQNTKDIFANKR